MLCAAIRNGDSKGYPHVVCREEKEMSGLLLCSSRRGNTSYVLEENKIEIRSLEELCFYLYQNAYRITEEFFSEELIRYLEEELEQKALAEKLLALKKGKADFLSLLLAVCEAANYYTQTELGRLKEELSDFAKSGKTERLKALADSCLMQKRYVQALKEYGMILAAKQREGYGEEFEGRIYHNMGTAYARMLLYREAEECFQKAWELLKDPRIQKDLLLLYYISENNRRLEELSGSFSEEELSGLVREWDELKKKVKTEAGRTGAVIEKWKQEYRREMT